ncbi:MAG: hypothetical protein ACP5D2_04595, partial [Candidatus Nanoarchaeia archaeon]
MEKYQIQTIVQEHILKRNEDSGEFELDCKELRELYNELYEDLINNPYEFLGMLDEYVIENNLNPSKSVIRIVDLGNKLEISNIRKQHIGKLTQLRGVIKMATKVYTRTTKINFICPSCGNILSIPQDRKAKVSPDHCQCGRKSNFQEESQIKENIQELTLEELPEEIESRQPQQIRIYLNENLTDPSLSDKLQPGRRVDVVGVIASLPPFMTEKDKEMNISDFMIYARDINTLEAEECVYLDDEDIKEIKEIASYKPLERLSESLVPDVYGNEYIKKAIVLQLVKGVEKKRPDGSKTRNDIHILLSGDPGVSKSATLNAVKERTPRARMVVGTKTSRVGLGAMAQKDELSGQWSLSAGALVLSSGSALM